MSYHRNEVMAYVSTTGPRMMFRGDAEKEAIFSRMPGSIVVAQGVDMPMTRQTILAFETWAEIERATKKYGEIRDSIVNVEVSGKYPPPLDGLSPYAHQVQTFELARLSMYPSYKQRSKEGTGFGVFLEQGMGKTKNVIEICRYVYRLMTLNVRPCSRILIVGRKGALLQWKSVLVECGFHEDHIVVLSGSKDARVKQMDEAIKTASARTVTSHLSPIQVDEKLKLPLGHEPTFVLMNWDVVPTLKPSRHRWDIAIADEAHRMKNRTTQVSKEMHEVADVTLYRIAMTGTPVGENPADLWSIYRFIDKSVFPISYTAFVRKYCTIGGFSGYEPTGILPDSVMDLIVTMYSRAHRSTKATAFDMPQKNYVVRRLKMKPRQAAAYRQLRDSAFDETDAMEPGDDTRRRVPVENALTRLQYLQQITCGFMTVLYEEDVPVHLMDKKPPMNAIDAMKASRPAVSVMETIDSRKLESESYDEYYARLDAISELDRASYKVEPSRLKKVIVDLDDAKTDDLVEFLREKHEEDATTRFAVWVTFRRHLDNINSRLVEEFGQQSVCYVDGRVPAERREEYRLEFNDRKSDRWIMILNDKAGCESLDLKSADYMCVMASIFSGVNRQQLEDRGHRAGRTRPYYVVDFVFPNTVDMVGLRAAQTKKNIAALITTSGFTRGIESDFKDPSEPIVDSRTWIGGVG